MPSSTDIFVALVGFFMFGCGSTSPAPFDGGADAQQDADGNAESSDACSATCQTEATPQLALAVDKPALATELLSTNIVTVTLTASGGFAGDVALAANVVDGSNVAVPGWTVVLDKASVTLAPDGTANVVATLTIPSENTGLAGTIKIDGTASVGTKHVETTVTVMNQITFSITSTGTDCVYPADAVGTVNVSNGTKLSFYNASVANNIVIHIGGGINGLNHEQGMTGPGMAYEQTVADTVGTTDWYCHNFTDPKDMYLHAVP
jgi:hypothetical protein